MEAAAVAAADKVLDKVIIPLLRVVKNLFKERPKLADAAVACEGAVQTAAIAVRQLNRINPNHIKLQRFSIKLQTLYRRLQRLAGQPQVDVATGGPVHVTVKLSKWARVHDTEAEEILREISTVAAALEAAVDEVLAQSTASFQANPGGPGGPGGPPPGPGSGGQSGGGQTGGGSATGGSGHNGAAGSSQGGGGGGGGGGSGGYPACGYTIVAMNPLFNMVLDAGDPQRADPEKLQQLRDTFSGKLPLTFPLLKSRLCSDESIRASSVEVRDGEVFLRPHVELSWDIVGDVLAQVLTPADNVLDYVQIKVGEAASEEQQDEEWLQFTVDESGEVKRQTFRIEQQPFEPDEEEGDDAVEKWRRFFDGMAVLLARSLFNTMPQFFEGVSLLQVEKIDRFPLLEFFHEMWDQVRVTGSSKDSKVKLSAKVDSRNVSVACTALVADIKSAQPADEDAGSDAHSGDPSVCASPADAQKLQLLHRVFDGKERLTFPYLRATSTTIALPNTSVHIVSPPQGEDLVFLREEEQTWDVIMEVLTQVLDRGDNLFDYMDVELDVRDKHEKVDPPLGMVRITSMNGVLEVEGDVLAPPRFCPSCNKPSPSGASYNYRLGKCIDCMEEQRQSEWTCQAVASTGVPAATQYVPLCMRSGHSHTLSENQLSRLTSKQTTRASKQPESGSTITDQVFSLFFPQFSGAENGPAAAVAEQLVAQIAENVSKAILLTSSTEEKDRAFAPFYDVQGLPENIIKCTLQPCKPEEVAPCWDSVVAIPVEGTIACADAVATEVKGVLVACFLPEPPRIRVCDAKFWVGEARGDFDPFWRLREEEFPIDYLGESLADGSAVKSGTRVKQTWRIRNAGQRVWDHRIWLVEEDPEDEDNPQQHQLPAGVKPTQEAEVTVYVDVPKEPGPFEKEFRIWLFNEHTDNIFTVELVSDPNAGDSDQSTAGREQ